MPPTRDAAGRSFTLARVARAVWRRTLGRTPPVNSFRGVYGTFDEARAAAPRSKPLGYDQANTTQWYTGKHERVTLEDYPAVYWLRTALETGRKVFEVGGHLGVAYYGYASILEYPADLEWTIWDVPSVTAAGEALARARGRTNLRFVTDPRACEAADIVLAAGSLQYVESPSLAETLAAFRRRPRHVIVNSTPVYDGPTFVTLQDIGTALCPYRIFGREELVASMGRLGFSLVDAWEKPRAVRIAGHRDRGFDHYSGFYFRAT